MIENKLRQPSAMVKWKKTLLYLILCLVPLNITACDYVFKNFYHLPSVKTTERPPSSEDPTTIEPAAGHGTEAIKVTSQNPKISINKVRDSAIRLKKNDTNFSVDPVEINIEKPTTKNETEKETKNLETPALASLQNLSPQERLKNLESRVQKITDTLNKMSPAITRLIGIENELDALTFQLEALIDRGQFDHLAQNKNNATPTSTGAQTAQAPKAPLHDKLTNTPRKAVDKIASITPAAGVSSQAQQTVTIHKLRSGDHAGKTRLVFETNNKVIPTIKIDNDKKLLVIGFGLGTVESDVRRMTRSSDMLKTATIIKNPQNNHLNLAYDLKNNSSVLNQEYIGPDKEIENHRYVIDIKR